MKGILTSTVDEYIKVQPKEIQAALKELRNAIKAAAPKAEEIISYRIPTYKQNGALCHFAAFKDHCSFVVVNKNILKDFEKELKEFETTSGATIHFTPENPLSSSLVQKIVRQRVKENEGLASLRKIARRK